MKKRIFLAINIPQFFIHEFKDESIEYKKLLVQSGIKNIRMVPLENMHITVYFLGFIEEKKIEKLSEILEEIFSKTKEFKIKFKNIHFMPLDYPRMIWSEFESKEFNLMVGQIGKILDQFLSERLKLNKERIIPHLTICRFTRSQKAKKIKLKQPETDKKEFLVKSINLMESKLSRKGAKYFFLKDFILKSDI